MKRALLLKPLRMSLLTKAIVGTALLVAASVLCLAAIFLAHHRSAFNEQLGLRAAALAHSVAGQSQFSILVANRSDLDRLARNTLASDPDVLWVTVEDGSGSTLSAVTRTPVRIGQIPPGSAAGAKTSSLREVRAGASSVIEVMALVVVKPEEGLFGPTTEAGAVIGHVRVGMSLASQRALFQDTLLHVGLFALFVVVVACAIDYAQIRALLNPVRDLMALSRAVGRGDLTHTTPITREDELGILAHDFNTMVADLRDSREQLLMKVQEAEQANRMKSEFLANMSHEIRTPMNAIIGMTDLALDAESPAEQRDHLNTVKTSAQSLLTIINDILDFSKVEAGKLEIDPVPFDLEKELDQTVRTLALRCHQKGLELLRRVEGGIPRVVLGDAGRLRQVLVNLLGNAAKFTPAGEILLDVRVAERTADQMVLEFRIKDTGIGIPKDRQKSIFDPFTQVDGSTTRRYGGTGLGLAICHRLVELMHGTITVESEPGQGSVFSFTARFGLTDRHSEVLEPLPLVSVKGIRTLIVDDNATNRAIVSSFVRMWGMNPEAVETGSEALQLLRHARGSENPFGLVILDVQMPEMDGFELAQAIRNDPEANTTAIMMLTSADLTDATTRCRELGIRSYLVKPVSKLDLKSAIEMCLADPVGRRSLPSAAPARPATPLYNQSLKVLIAEDNPVNQKLAARLLEKCGYEVIIAGTGAEAVALTRSVAPDVVLMDVQMPEMDGYEATAALRNNPATAGLPIIAMTAHAMKGDRERCLAAGMDSYIAKPVNGQELIRLIEHFGYTRSSEAGGAPGGGARTASTAFVEGR